ncbi:MAG: DUF2341 domain-containing protein [Candidatus Thorarchaeota archaeon]|nr:DUF2341 domain-containing protein [Candidatus Thorarchaeota archaeon]
MRKPVAAIIICVIFLLPSSGAPESSLPAVFQERVVKSNSEFEAANWLDESSGTGMPRQVDFQGMAVSSGTSVIDATHPGYIGSNPPPGWSSKELEGQLEHLSLWVDDILTNPNLDAYHEERWFMISNPEYNSDSFYIPTGWTFVKNDALPSGTQHPQHGYFEINGVSGYGYDATMGWRFDANLDSGATLNPNNGIYISQQVSAPWRSIYSAEITFRYYVSSTSTLNDQVYIFTSLEGHVTKHHVFDIETQMDTWLQVTATVPSSFFETLGAMDSLLFNIGLGTDINGNPDTADHEVYVDEVGLKLLVRPFPEQIDLLANGARVTGSTQGSVSPYVPDGSNRDCYSWIGGGGVDLNGYGDNGWLEVGGDVPDYPDWSTATAYQVGLSFPLYVPQGSMITSATLQVETPSDSTGFPGMRIYIADEENIPAFTNGLPSLPDRFDWVNTSIYWRPTTWIANGRYTSPDLSALLQRVVSRPGWQSGNFICVMIDYAYSNQDYCYNQIKGSTGFSQGDLARIFVDFTAPDAGDVIPSFRYNKKIVIDHTQVVSDLQGFPVLLDIWDEDLHLESQTDGDDIAFLCNGQVIPHEIDSYNKLGNGTHAHLTAWVKVPYLSSVQDTTIIMVYGDDDLGKQENPSEVWDSDFSAVWHLGENPAQPQWSSTYADYLPHQPQILDATSPRNDGTSYGTMTSGDLVQGVVGGAIDLEGTDDYLDFGNPAELQMSGAFTVEAWFYAGYIDNDYLVVKSGESNYRGWDISFDDDPSISPAGWVMFRWSPDGVNTNVVGYERVETGQWYHVVGVFNPSQYTKFYLNGELVDEVTTGIPASSYNPNRPVRIGRRSDTTGATSYFDGVVDEVRVSAVARSDAWIMTQYNNQRNPGQFVTVGEEDSNFRYEKDIIINHNKVTSDLYGFPVLIDIFDADLRVDVQGDGDDIMFTSNGRNIPHEIELFDQQYNSTHAHLVAWVKADLSSTSDTVLSMYYGNPLMGSQENPDEVWRSNYAGVWHFGESSGNAHDSSPFGQSGVVSGGVAQSQPGVVGKCYEFDGVDGNVLFGDPGNGHLDFGVNAFSYGLWIRFDQSTDDYQLPLFKGGTTTSEAGYEFETNQACTDAKAEVADGGTQVISSATSVTFGQWMYLVAVVDPSTNTLRLYTNGAQTGAAQDISSLTDVSNSLNFQASPLSYPVYGAIDEIRILSVAPTADWILTEYENQYNPSSFISLGTEREIIPMSEGPSGFMYKKDITVDHNKVDSDLYSFPLLVELYDSDLRTHVQADGDDIIFVKDGWMLPHEIELFDQSYNSSHAHLIAWVRTDLSALLDTIISMYYGSPESENQENPTEVWGTSFAAVWHLSEDPAGAVLDSTMNGNDGVGQPIGSEPTLQSGIIDGCAEFYGAATNDRIEAPHSSSLVIDSDVTVEVWVRTDNTDGSSDAIVAKWGDVGHRNYWLGKLDDSTLAFFVDDTQNVTAPLSLVNDGFWHHVVGVARAASGVLLLYVDGIEQGYAPYSGVTQTGTSVIQIGNNPGSDGFIQEWDGRIDEIRVSRSCRSASWILTEFNNQQNPAAFYAVGDEGLLLDFAFKKEIVVDHTKVDANLENFPLLVDIFDADLKTKCQNDGDDIIFKSGDAALPHELELFEPNYNSTHAHLVAWVKVDLSSTADTTITMYYGSSEASNQENPEMVWDTGYVGVWHFSESTGGTDAIEDSTFYQNHGTDTGSPSFGSTGAIGNAISFDGENYILVSNSPSLNSFTNQITLEAWTRADSYEWESCIFAKGGEDTGALSLFYWRSTGTNDVRFNLDGVTSGSVETGVGVTRNDWMHVVLTYDGSVIRVYTDGVMSYSNPYSGNVISNSQDFFIASETDYDDNFLGLIDEARISNIAKTQERIQTEYRNQNDPSSFYSVGIEQLGNSSSDTNSPLGASGFQFTTDSVASVQVEATLYLGLRSTAMTLANDFTLGTSFSIENGTIALWTANVLVSPPPQIDSVSFEVSYPEGDWYPVSVRNPLTIEKSFGTDWTCFNGNLMVGASTVDEYGVWKIQFQGRNHVFDALMGPLGGPYSSSDEFSIGEDIEFRIWSSGTIGSATSLELTDPSGSTWYSGITTLQGQSFALPYYHRKPITISSEDVGADLTNFPVLIDIYDSDLKTDVRADGRDIAFAIGEETLSHEIELFDQTYNETHAHLVAWAKVPMLSGSIDTILSMYYGNPLAPIVYDSGLVWDAGYLGVWHLSESGTGALNEYLDSSQYKHHGQGGEGNTSFVPTRVTGKIGSGQDFNNLDGYYDLIDCGDSPMWNIDGYQITLEAWIQHDITPNTHVYGIMNHKGWYNGYSLFINYGGGSTLKPTFSLPGETHQLRGANDVTGEAWHHIVATYDGSLMRIYVDGVQDPNVLVKTDTILPSTYEQGFWIGHGDQPKDKGWSAEWVGQLDEVRISDAIRSADWIQTEYQNQNDPSDFCSVGAEEDAGYFESESISLDSSASAGVWRATARNSNAGTGVNDRVGIFSRNFIVKHASFLSLVAPGDAISDGVSARLIGEGLYVEYELADTLNSNPISGATITMNWTVGGTPTEVQLDDYGEGVYGKALNTTDLATAQRWRIEFASSHQFYSTATSILLLDLSHQTYLTYEPPSPVGYGDDFAVRVTLRDSFDNLPVANAEFTSDGTLVGEPIDYGNGTYLLTLESSGLSIGTHSFELTATPTDSFLLSTSIDVQFTYRSVVTEAYPYSDEPAEIPWGEDVTVLIQWNDLDHGGIGIQGGTISILPSVSIQTVDNANGHYTLTIVMASYAPGTYFFNVTISKTNYEDATFALAVIVVIHKTSASADHSPSTPVGTSTYFDIAFLDIDSASSTIGLANLSQVILDWGTGSQSFTNYGFWLDTSAWAVGIYEINITVYSAAEPQYYSDATISIELEIRKLGVYVSWENLEPFPNGDDFILFIHLNISEPGTSVDGNPIDGLDQTYIVARNSTGWEYTLKSFTDLFDGRYRIVIDQSLFQEGDYTIIVLVDFLASENYIDTHTPVITFSYRPIRTYLLSDDYPTVTTTYDTNVTVVLNYVDIDNGVNITTGIVTAEGASIIWQHLGDGFYRVVVIVQGWDLGSHEVNITVDAPSYQAKTLSFEVLVQIAYAFARSSASSIDLPLGDIAVFYVDYWDIIHEEPIPGALIENNWTYAISVTWTGSQYRVELPSYETSQLGSYLIVFNVSKGSNYQIGYFNISLTLRTHYTEFILASAVEPTTYIGMVNVSLYYGDLDNDVGIRSQYVNASVYGKYGWIESYLENDTIRGNGFYIIRFMASALVEEGIYNFTVYFNWTGPVQQFFNGMVRTSVTIIGEESELSLEDSPGPTPYLENMTYIYFYSELYSGVGISNSSGNVFISIEFLELTIDSSLISIFEGAPGHYTIEFNTTVFSRPGIYTMIVHVNWSASISPFYDNRTDTISVRVIPRNTAFAVTPPDSTPYGVNATFSFTYDDVSEAVPISIANSPQLTLVVNLPDYTITYNSTSRRFYVSFNSSILGPSLGSKQFTISVTWIGSPFYANITIRTVLISVIARETSFDFVSPAPTAYGEVATFSVTFLDVTNEPSSPISDGLIVLFDASLPIPVSYYGYVYLGSGQYSISLDTSYYGNPGSYNLMVEISTGHFYYLDATSSRIFNVRYRLTTLAAESVGTIAYNSTIQLVVHYRDLLSLIEIGNTSYFTHMEILNGSSWLYTCEWRDGSQDYLLTIQTYNQALEISKEYLLLIRFSYSNLAPYYLSSEAYVSFRLRERTTFLDVTEAPLPAPYLDSVNFTFVFRDLELSHGIEGAEILLSIGVYVLEAGTDYALETFEGGVYQLSVSTAAIGMPGTTSSLLVRAQWTSGAPYYTDAYITLGVSVTERPASAGIVSSVSQVRFLDNVTFTFSYVDDGTTESVILTKSMVSVYSGGSLLQGEDFTMSYLDGVYEISVNSTILSVGLVTALNVTVFVDWPSNVNPYYTDDAASVRITIINRSGLVNIGSAPITPIGNNMSLTFSYTDEETGIGIDGAIIEFDCLDPSGLVENLSYWVIRGSGTQAGHYTILVDSRQLNGVGQYSFSLRLLWNPSVAPYYRNTSEVLLLGSIRLIQSLLTNGDPDPSTVPINDNVTVVLTFVDLDNGDPISEAQSYISVIYKISGSAPTIWSVAVLSPGIYELVVNCTDAGSMGTNALVVRITMSDYQFAEVQVPIQIRAREGELSKYLAPDAYFGEQTYVIVELVDLDSFSSPIADASLGITWPRPSSYTYIGNGRYNISLSTTTLNAGLYTLLVSATKSNYFIPDISISIRIRAIPTEIILPLVIPDVYWGESVSVWALFNDTRSGTLISGAVVVYMFGPLEGSLIETTPPGNYTFSANTGSLPIATAYVISITASMNNYVLASGQITVNVLRLGLELAIVDGLNNQILYKGEPVNITVFVRDVYHDAPLAGATVTARWSLAGQDVLIYLTQVPGRNGFYTGFLDSQDALVKTYVVIVQASRTNYVSMSTSASISIRQIPTEVWLDALTATYGSASFNWSDTVRIGVYVLCPFLNESYPYSTGLSNCTVTWSLSGTVIAGEFLNGTTIGGPGYFYFDFRTWEYNATTYTLRITANPNVRAFAISSNMTTLTINPIETAVEVSYVSPKVWGWAGWVNLTYWDLLGDRGILGAGVSIDWAGIEEVFSYVSEGTYQIWINTSLVSPGVYPIVVSFWKQNYEGGIGVTTLTVEEVPTSIVAYTPPENLDEGENSLRVPIGDVLSVVLFYNDTWYNQGILGATELRAVIMGPSISDKEYLQITELSNGNYSFVIDSSLWTVSNQPYRIVISLALENRSRSTLTLYLTIIDIPTALSAEFYTVTLSYSQTVIVNVFYYDTWPGHGNRGISGGTVNATSLNMAYVYTGEWRPDESNPGWYEITVISLRAQGSAVVIVELSGGNCETARITLAVSVEPSDADILFERTLIYGLPIGVICLIGAILWSRLFSLPKLLRDIRGMIRAIDKGRIPKVPDGVRTRRELITELFNDVVKPLGILRSADTMPDYSLTAEVPEIEELLIQLAILTKMKQEELEEFRSDLSKMRLSEQVEFVKEVINQEAIKRSKIERKSMEMVLKETLEQARAQLSGREAVPLSEPDIAEEEVSKEDAEPIKPDAPKAEDELPPELLTEEEINEIRKKLIDAGIGGNELETIMEQVHELPKELADDLLRSILRKGGGKP